MGSDEAPPEQVERVSVRAMGTDVEVIGVDVPRRVLARAAASIEALEQRWSRFIPTSELSRLNGAGGVPVVLPAITFDLVEASLAWCRTTHGWFDPTVLPALLDAGYDRTFEQIDAAAPRPVAPEGPSGPTPGPEGVELHARLRSVRLAPGVALDLGGIGKGRAADLVADELSAAGHRACVNLGGDLRAVGRGPGGAWSVGVDDPFNRETTVAVIGIVDGAVATSSSARRVWTSGGRRQHHLIDPHTGRPSAHPPSSVTVVAPTAVEAEVWAKAILLAGPVHGVELLAESGLPALIVDRDGPQSLNGMDAYLW